MGGNPPGFNPRSISLNIRTPEELAALNQFLLTLGRDAEPRQPDGGQYSSYFDINQLNQLGIGSMPGIAPTSYDNPTFSNVQQPSQYSYSQPARPPAPPSQSQWNAELYGNLHESVNGSYSGRISSSANMMSMGYAQQGHMQPTPPLDTGSPNSGHSSPPTMTPPHRLDPFDAAFAHITRRVPSNVPPAMLASPDYGGKQIRATIPLRSLAGAVGSITTPQARTITSTPTTSSTAEPPTPPVTPPRDGTASSGSSLYPLLTDGDRDLKLPPLRGSRSQSPPANSSLPSLRSLPIRPPTPESPQRRYPSLPPSSPTATTDERLAKRFGALTLDRDAERARHALLIRDLLVLVNERYARESALPDATVATAMDIKLPAQSLAISPV